MSLEAAAVIDKNGNVIYWHCPENRTTVTIPHSQDLWEIIWSSKDRVDGIAHTHPGSGYPSPSHEDITTFAAIEAGLGVRLKWWILSSNSSVLLEWDSKSSKYMLTHSTRFGDEEPGWMRQLRSLSFPL